jgi:hypothetical protein
MPKTCRDGRLRRCGRPAVGVCQYCAAPFCAEHGARYPEDQEVCRRARCRAKYADVERFQVYRRRVHQRNAFGSCGAEGCLGALFGQCSRCKGNFCVEHVRERRESRVVAAGSDKRMLAVCDYCRTRKAWQ